MRKCIALIGFACMAVLASCDSKPVAKDGYTFDQQEYVNPNPDINFVMHDNATDLVADAPAYVQANVKKEGRELQAWSQIRGNTCEVHILDPVQSYKPEWIGHEITHCVYGRWHK